MFEVALEVPQLSPCLLDVTFLASNDEVYAFSAKAPV